MIKSLRSRFQAVRRFLRGEIAAAVPSEPSSSISSALAFDRMESMERMREYDKALHPLMRPFLLDDMPFDEGQSAMPQMPHSDNGFVPLWAWHALPGGVLELAATGYAIHLNNDPSRHPYRVRDPDGRWIASSADLQHMKDTAERNASDRAELMLSPDRIAAGAQEFLRRLGL